MELKTIFLFDTTDITGKITICSIADLRTGGHWFYPQLGLYSFRGLTIVIATGFIPLSHGCPLFQQLLCGKATSGLDRILCRVVVKRTTGKHGKVYWPPRYN